MKKKMVLIIITLFVFSFKYIVSNEIKNDKLKLAVLNFASKDVSNNLIEAIIENLTTSLIISGHFEVIERIQLERIMNELNLQNSDDFNDKIRLELGNLYGAEMAILGSVIQVGDIITTNIRGVEISTGIAKFAKKFSSSSEEEVLKNLNELIISELVKNEVLEKEKKNNISMYKTGKSIELNRFSKHKMTVTGMSLAFTGIGLAALGGFSVGFSYYFVWYAIYSYLQSSDFVIKSWTISWQAAQLLASMGSVPAAFAFIFLAVGITFCVASLMMVPGIIFWILGKKKKNISQKFHLLEESCGFAVRL